MRPPPLILLLALALVGCATFKKADLAEIRGLGVPPALVAKLEHRRPLTPEDCIVLKRARVGDELVVRQLDRVGIDYLLTRPDILRLRHAGVAPSILAALVRESNRFAAFHSYDEHRDYAPPPVSPLHGEWVSIPGAGF